eukprot:943895-Ditylum_brightwellii.AAC.1
MQQQDKFIFNRSLDQWEISLTISMCQWLVPNRLLIKHCLSTKLKQTLTSSSDIWDYLPIESSLLITLPRHNYTNNQHNKNTKKLSPV